MRVCITGGAGFIGHHLARACLAAGDDVVVIDNLRRGDPARLPDGVHTTVGDIRDRASVDDALRGVQRVYHLAAQSNVLGAVTDLDYSFTSNVIGTYNVLAAAHAASVERVVFASSREAYGEVEAIPVREDRAMNPKNGYGASKVAGEVYCRTFQSTYGLDVSVLRLANVYGAGDQDRVIPIWLECARAGLDLELYGGQQVIDFVPVALVVQALRRAGEQSLGGQPINVGSGKATTLRDLAARVRSLSGVSVGERILPARAIEVTRFVADVSRMRDLLNLTPPEDPLVQLPEMWANLLATASPAVTAEYR
jgi:UDP-glucose 4-epimerase